MNYPTTEVPRGPTLWPDRTVAKLEYLDLDNVVAIEDATQATRFYYCMNNPYNPDLSGSTFIAGLSEYSSQYYQFRVLATSCRVSVYAQPGQKPLIITLAPFADNTLDVPAFRNISTSESVKQGAGNPYTRMKIIGANSTQSSGDVPTIYQYISMQKLLGSSSALTSDTYAGYTGGTGGGTAIAPSNLTYWSLGVSTLDGTNVGDQGPLFQTKICYWVEFYSRIYQYS